MNHAEPNVRPRAVWPRVVLVLAMLIVAFVIGGYISSRFDSSRAQKEREEIEAYLDEADPNWRLADIERTRAEVPPQENSALVVMTARRLMPKIWPSEQFSRVFTHNLPSNQRFTDEQIAAIRTECAAVEVALEQARKLEGLPRGKHRLEWAFNPFATLLPDQGEVRQVAGILQYDAWMLAHEGDIDGALRSCRACLNAGRSLSDEPLLISQLIRFVCITFACNAIERALFHGQASSTELAKVQELLALEDQHPSLRIALRGERAGVYDVFLKVRDGQISGGEVLTMGTGRNLTIWQRIFGVHVSSREPVLHLKRMTKLIEGSEKSHPEQLAAERQFEADLMKVGGEMAMTKSLSPGVGKTAHAHRRKMAQVRCTMTLVAVERYRMKHGDWPMSLEALVPQFLNQVPLDPFDGKPLRFKRLENGIAVYSVGNDGTDDGGNINRNQPNGTGVDHGYWLWDRPAEKLPEPLEER